jgi:hypothetical protein
MQFLPNAFREVDDFFAAGLPRRSLVRAPVYLAFGGSPHDTSAASSERTFTDSDIGLDTWNDAFPSRLGLAIEKDVGLDAAFK